MNVPVPEIVNAPVPEIVNAPVPLPVPEIVNVPEASVSPAAPTMYLADDGGFIHPLGENSDPKLVDRDLMVYALKAGYGRKGAKIGSRDGDAELFRADMLAFWRRTLGAG